MRGARIGPAERRRRKGRMVGALLVVQAVAGTIISACGGGGAGGGGDTGGAASAGLAQPAITEPVASGLATTTSPPATSPPTTGQPATTTSLVVSPGGYVARTLPVQRGIRREKVWTPEQQAVADTIHRFQDVYWAAVTQVPVDTAPAELSAVTSAEVTDGFFKIFSEDNARGLAVRYPSSTKIATWVWQVMFLPDGRAQAHICEVDDALMFEVATEKVVNDNVVTTASELILSKSDDRWIVVSFHAQKEWEGVDGCDHY